MDNDNGEDSEGSEPSQKQPNDVINNVIDPNVAKNDVVNVNEKENINVNMNVNKVKKLENKRTSLVAELSNDIKRINPPKFDGIALGDGDEKFLSEMEKYFSIRNFLEETKAVWGAYQLSNEASSWWDNWK
ncbi:hypothetical protein KI387_026746, partial [Taxus chinensis]